MEISKQAKVLLERLETASGGRSKIALDSMRAVFLEVFPQWQGLTDRRERLRTLINELAAAGRVQLPQDQRRGWEQHPAPALPRSISLVRELSVVDASFNHRTFPWVLELAFVAGLRAITNPEELRCIHNFLRDHPERRPIVPVKERAFQLFGDEKRLDDLRKTKLFDTGRLTLEMLRCRDVAASLPCVPAPRLSSSTWLIVENEATFDSFTRLNRVLSLHAGIVLGSGRNVLRAMHFLETLLTSSVHRDFLYFGDIDKHGIAIPVLLDRHLYERTGHHVVAAAKYYEWLLESARIVGSQSAQLESSTTIEWLPVQLREPVQTVLSQGRHLAQEAVGWEFLRTKFRLQTTNDSSSEGPARAS